MDRQMHGQTFVRLVEVGSEQFADASQPICDRIPVHSEHCRGRGR